MKEDFHFCFLVITSFVSPLFCLNAIGSIYNHDFNVKVWCNELAHNFTVLRNAMGQM